MQRRSTPLQGGKGGEIPAVFQDECCAVRELVRRVVYCTKCGALHVDRDKYARCNHRKHLCAVCGAYFYSAEACVGVEHVHVAASSFPAVTSQLPSSCPAAALKPPGNCPATTQQLPKTTRKLVRVGRFYVPIPEVTTLSDTIEEALKSPPAGWQEWLRKYGIWDPAMTREASFTRFYKFHKIKFDAIPEERWPTFF